MTSSFLNRVHAKAREIRVLRDVHGWPEPRTVEELRADPRYLLRNRPGGKAEDENLVFAGALLVLVAEDLEGRSA